jgi:hypothetical protein
MEITLNPLTGRFDLIGMTAAEVAAYVKVAGDTMTGSLTLAAELYLTSPSIPSQPNSTGLTGQISWDSDYIYISTGVNTWKRVVIATWAMGNLLLENGDFLLLESGDKLILE